MEQSRGKTVRRIIAVSAIGLCVGWWATSPGDAPRSGELDVVDVRGSLEFGPQKPVPRLLPRSQLFGEPRHFSVGISPDGTTLSFLAPEDGVANLWTAPTRRPKDAMVHTQDRHRGVHNYMWAANGEHLLYLRDQDGDENDHVFAIDLSTGRHRNLTPGQGNRAQILARSASRPGAIALLDNNRDRARFDIWLADLETGHSEMVHENRRGFVHFVLDDQLFAQFGLRVRDGGDLVLESLRPDDCGRELLEVPADDAMSFRVLGMTPSGGGLYMLDARGRDTAALVEFDLASGRSTQLHASPDADVDRVLFDPVGRQPVAASVNHARVQWTAIDTGWHRDFRRFSAAFGPGADIEIVSVSADMGTMVIEERRSDAPVAIHLHRRDPGRLQQLFVTRPELKRAALAPMQVESIKTRDGLDMVSYLTLPVGSDSDADGRPQRALPLVLMVHGGPWHRDQWGFRVDHQWLANRGYAVLSVNFRASVGFGKSFVNAGDRAWGKEMQHDLSDSVAWAVAQGIAQADKVAIMGGSYGGYATLAGLAFTPDLYACGIDIVGPSNLVTLLESIPEYWKPGFEMMARRVGDPRTPQGRALLRERSPLHRAQAIAKPLLIAQGARDPRVKRAESDQIVAALQESRVPVTYLVYPDEGHGFVRPDNRLSFIAIAEAFLAKCLGGSYEPIGASLQRSSVQVPVGAGHVPGLAEALAD